MKYRRSCQSALCTTLVKLMRRNAPIGMGLEEGEVELTFDGMPPPLAGQWFWGVYGGDLKITADTDFTTEPIINVMLSARTGDVPFDRLGEHVHEDDGWMARAEHFAAWLAQRQYDWMNAANDFLSEGAQTPVNGLIEPGFRIQLQGVRPANADHWKSTAGRNDKMLTPVSPAGIVGTIRISEFKRVQYLEVCSNG